MPDGQTSESVDWQLAAEAAEAYERDLVPALFEQWVSRTADALDLRPGDRVLDVACGTGIVAREALSRVSPEGLVAGLDLNPGMLTVARRVAPGVEWRQGDAAALPFQDTVFDAVSAQFALMFFPDREAALREMWRVLAPGGRLAVAVWSPIETCPAEAGLLAILRDRVGDAVAANLAAPFCLGDPEDFTALWEAAGLPAPRIETHAGEARFESLERFVEIEIKASPMANLIDESQYREILADAQDALTAFARSDGFRFPLEIRIGSARKG